MLKFIGRSASKLVNKVWSRSKSPIRHETHQELTEEYITTRKLPSNFADELLNSEIELEQGKYTIPNIKKLIDLYNVAIKYYESIMNNKQYIFQNKLKVLMENPKVLEALNSGRPQKINNTEAKNKDNLTQKQRAENFHQEFLKNAVKELEVPRFRESLTEKIADVQNLIEGQISNQEDVIKRKLEERRKNKLERPKSQPPSRRITENDEKTPKFTKTPVFTRNIWDEFAKMKKKIYEEEEGKIKIDGVWVSKYEKEIPRNKNSSISKQNYAGMNFYEESPPKNEKKSLLIKDKSPKFKENSRDKSPKFTENSSYRDKSPKFTESSSYRDKSPKFSENSINSSSRQNYQISSFERNEEQKKEEKTKNSSFLLIKKKQK